MTLSDANWKQEMSIAVTPNSGTELSGVFNSTVSVSLMFDELPNDESTKSLNVSESISVFYADFICRGVEATLIQFYNTETQDFKFGI